MKRLTSLLIVLTLVLPLAACEKTDTGLVVDFVNGWLESRGAMAKDKDGNYKPTLKGVGVAMGFTSTGDEQADAAMEAGKLTKDIADNDKLMREGEDAYNKTPPDTATAKKKMDTAVSNRPDDWYYRNHRAYMSLQSGDEAAAQEDLKAGINGCGGNNACLAALYRDRAQFYTASQLGSSLGGDKFHTCAIVTMGAESYQALAGLSSGANKSNYESLAKSAQDRKKDYCS